MKNLFFVFLLLGSFAFASNTGTIESNITLENMAVPVETIFESTLACGFDVSWETDGPYGSGSSWFDCDGWSMQDIMDHIMEVFF